MGSEAQGTAEALSTTVEWIMKVFGSNAGGFVINWLLLIVMAIMLFFAWRNFLSRMQKCENKHAACERRNRKLALAFVYLAGGHVQQARELAQRVLSEEDDDGEDEPDPPILLDPGGRQ
jgi:hypothetical protein